MPSDIYRKLTNKIVKQIEAGTPPWRQPWDSRASGIPRNAATKKPYRGINILLLWEEANQRGFASNLWATYRQWQAIGGQIRRGERATKIVFWKTWDQSVTDLDTGTEREEKRFVLREINLFNLDQCQGHEIQHLHQAPQRKQGFIDFQPAEDLINATGAKILHGGNRAYYNSESDQIFMPLKQAFESPQDYYGTALHELAHWSGHPDRLNRLDRLARFGDHSYSMEELLAELSASFLSGSLGLPGTDWQDRSAGYIDSWLAVLRSDAQALSAIAALAGKVADFILSYSQTKEAKGEAA